MVFGKVKRIALAVVFLFVAIIADGQTGKNFTYHFDGNPDGGSVIASERNLIISYSLSDLYLQSITNSEGDFFKISAPGHNRTSVTGKPELPVFSRLITIPENSEITVKLSDVSSQKIRPSGSGIRGLVYPRQADAVKTEEKQRAGFIIDKSEYGRRGYIEADTVRIEYLGKIRGNRLATIHISPVRYNPFEGEMEVITSMKVEIFFHGSGNKSSSSGAGESALFAESLGKGTLNYDQSDIITGYSDKPVRMIILTDTAFRKHLKPLISWKTRKGIKVTTLYKGAAFAGTTFTQLKDTLSKIYNAATADNPAPEYLLIIGDVNVIPRSEGTSQVSDLYYGEFDGNGDYLPDMYIGRLPAADTTEVKAVVNKIVQYESFQVADTNKFYKRTLITAGNDAGYATYMNGQVKYASTYYLNAANNIEGHSFSYPESANAEDSIKKLINTGVSFINYSGHGDVSGWLDPVIKIPEIALFSNKNMYPFVISNACQTAHYNIASSFGNKMVVSADKGAVGFIGCSNDSYWDEDFYWSIGTGPVSADPKYSGTGLGAYDRLFHKNGEKPSEWYITMGQVNYAGNLAVSASSSSKKKYYWETYTLLGDPSIIPFIGKPDTFHIALPDTLPNGIRSLSMTIDPFAYMAVSHWDTLWDASYASASGSVVIDFPGRSNDSCLVIITGQNKVPLIKKIYFANVNKEFINLTSTAINDAGANNNGIADYGETLYLKTVISNLGLAGTTGLYGELSTTSDWVTILNSYFYIGVLAGRSEIILANHFALKIDDLIPDKGYITLNLKLKDSKAEKNYKIDICLHAPDLETLSCIIDDIDTGNGDLIADPGETLDLIYQVANRGSSSISGTFRITGAPPGVTVNQTSVSTGLLTPGITKNISVSVSISPLVLKGSTFNISTLLECNPYLVDKTFSIAVGKVRESFEYQSFKIFPWVVSQSNPWIITSSQAYEGQFSARSAVISHNAESVHKIYVNTPVKDTIKFMYKVSSELNYDYLAFRINGTQLPKISGEAGWSEKKIELREGYNLIEWIYKKDESVSYGNDCAMIDFITFPSLGFNKVDLKTGKIITPVPNKDLTQEFITAEVINFGTDTVKSFNMAYSVNQNFPVYENFVKTIHPADTAVVGFKVPANMEGTGTYLVKVYVYNNNDGYLNNDTSKLTIYNTSVTPVENPENRLKVLPNPFAQSFRIILNTQTNDEIIISITDLSGRVSWKESASITAGENILTLSPVNLPSGFYTLMVKGKSIHKAARIIKK